jgi:hypothetical protein
VSVVTTAWMASGQTVYIATGGYYTVSSITDATHVVLTNTGYSGNKAQNATVSSGSAVSSGGIQGAAGATGATGTAGAAGTTGATGATGPDFLAGGSGSSVAAGSTVYLGFDSQSATEADEFKIVPTDMAFGHIYCSAPKPTGTSWVFTIRITTFSASPATASQATTCSVASGSTSGTAAGTISISAGQGIDVQVASGNAAGGASWSLGP